MNIYRYKLVVGANPFVRRAEALTTNFIMIVAIALLLPLKLRAEASNPNGIENKPEPGWRLWCTRDEAKEADFGSGFLNVELGGSLDFEYACKTYSRLPESEIKYWFRLSETSL